MSRSERSRSLLKDSLSASDDESLANVVSSAGSSGIESKSGRSRSRLRSSSFVSLVSVSVKSKSPDESEMLEKSKLGRSDTKSSDGFISSEALVSSEKLISSEGLFSSEKLISSEGFTSSELSFSSLTDSSSEFCTVSSGMSNVKSTLSELSSGCSAGSSSVFSSEFSSSTVLSFSPLNSSIARASSSRIGSSSGLKSEISGISTSAGGVLSSVTSSSTPTEVSSTGASNSLITSTAGSESASAKVGLGSVSKEKSTRGFSSSAESSLSSLPKSEFSSVSVRERPSTVGSLISYSSGKSLSSRVRETRVIVALLWRPVSLSTIFAESLLFSSIETVKVRVGSPLGCSFRSSICRESTYSASSIEPSSER